MKKLTNEQLLEQYMRANVAAFEEFYQRNQRLIYNFLRMRLKNKSDADDAFQETFFRIHKYILSYNTEQSALGWSLSIAKNIANDIHKKSAKMNETSSIDVDKLVSTNVSHKARDELVAIMKGLTEEEQRMLKAKFINDESYEEISETLNISESNARQRVSRLVKKIRSIV